MSSQPLGSLPCQLGASTRLPAPAMPTHLPSFLPSITSSFSHLSHWSWSSAPSYSSLPRPELWHCPHTRSPGDQPGRASSSVLPAGHTDMWTSPPSNNSLHGLRSPSSASSLGLPGFPYGCHQLVPAFFEAFSYSELAYLASETTGGHAVLQEALLLQALTCRRQKSP